MIKTVLYQGLNEEEGITFLVRGKIGQREDMEGEKRLGEWLDVCKYLSVLMK